MSLVLETSFAAVGCTFDAPNSKIKVTSERKAWVTTPILNNHIEFEDVEMCAKINGVVVARQMSRTVVSEWHDDPIDASIRTIREELDKQDSSTPSNSSSPSNY